MALLDAMTADSGSYTPESIETRRKLALAMLQAGREDGPVASPYQGINRVLQSMLGTYNLKQADKDDRAGKKEADEALLKALVPGYAGEKTASLGTGAVTDAGPAAALTGDIAPYANAIASIESAGSGDYAALGPQTPKGDRAYGRYQVMGTNVPEWTQKHLGKRMTPQEFLADPAAQDAVFKGEFGSYLKQYGNPDDAASIWFTGKPAAQGADQDDGYTAQPEYLRKFRAALQAGGGTTPVQTAQATGLTATDAAAAGTPPAAPAAPGAAMPARASSRLYSQAAALMRNPRTAELGKQMLLKAATAEAPAEPEGIREYRLYLDQGGKLPYFDYQKELKQAGRTQITNTVGAGETSLAKSAGEEVGKGIVKGRDAASSAVQAITSANETRDLLDSNAGVITGTGANAKLALGKVLLQLGVVKPGSNDAELLANTQAFGASQAKAVLASIKSLGANPSNADRDYLEKAEAGSIDMDEPAIRKVLDISERVNRQAIKTHNERVRKLGKSVEQFGLEVDEPEARVAKAAAKDQPQLKVGAPIDTGQFKSLPDGAVVRDAAGKRFRVEGGQLVPVQ